MVFETITQELFDCFYGKYNEIEKLANMSLKERVETVMVRHGLDKKHAVVVSGLLVIINSENEEDSDEADSALRDLFYDVIMPTDSDANITKVISALNTVCGNSGWQERSEDEMERIVAMNKNCLEYVNDEKSKQFTWSNVQDLMINKGRCVYLMNQVGRAKLEKAVCPKCGGYIMEDVAALSRFDNKTGICSECGEKEAFDNYYGIIDL